MKQLTKNVFVETELRGSNHGLVTTSDGIVLIDTPHKPSDAVRLRAEVERRGPLRYILNTEPHGDHWTGNAYFDAPVVAHEGVRTRILATDLPAHVARLATFGPEEPKLLEGYKLGKSDDDAFRHAIGKPTADFDSEFAEWAKEQVKDWGYDAETLKRFDALAKTGEEQIKAGQLREAMTTWQEATKLQPHNPLPHRRLAGLHIRLGSPKEALPHLRLAAAMTGDVEHELAVLRAERLAGGL